MSRARVAIAGAFCLLGCSSESLVGLSVGADEAPRSLDFCSGLPALGSAPIIDGLSDSSFALRALPRDTWREPKNPLPSSEGAEYLLGWVPGGIYFYVQVLTPDVRPSPGEPLWCGDAVHLFLDGDGRFASPPSYDTPGTRQFIVPAPEGASPNTTRAGATGAPGSAFEAWRAPRFGAFLRDGGYSVEALITPSDLGAPLELVAGSQVGFSLSISVSGVRLVPNAGDPVCEGLRLGDFALALGDGACVSPHCNVDAFCSPTLEP